MSDQIVYVDEQENEVNPQGQGGYNYAPTARPPSDKADLLDKIKPDLIVEVIRNKLMGKELINGKWIDNKALKSRALTETGAWDIANLMLGASSQNVSLSKLTDPEIRARTLEIVRTTQRMLLKNWNEYGITGTDQLEFVHQIVFTNTFITLKQPQNGGIRDLIKGTTADTTVRNISDKEKRGFWK